MSLLAVSRHHPLAKQPLCATSGHSIPAHYANDPKSDRIVELLDAIRRICASVASGAIRFPLNGSAFSEEKKLSIAAPPQQVVRRDHLVEAKLVKQLPLISVLPPHHRRLSCRLLSWNHCSLRSSTPFSTASVKLGSGGTSTLLLLCSNERTLRCGNTIFGRCHKETLGAAGGRAAHPTRSFAHPVGEEGLIGE